MTFSIPQRTEVRIRLARIAAAALWDLADGIRDAELLQINLDDVEAEIAILKEQVKKWENTPQ